MESMAGRGGADYGSQGAYGAGGSPSMPPPPTKRAEPSLAEASVMVMNQSQSILLRASMILSHMDGRNEKPESGAVPEMPLVARLMTSYEYMAKTEQILLALEKRIFG